MLRGCVLEDVLTFSVFRCLRNDSFIQNKNQAFVDSRVSRTHTTKTSSLPQVQNGLKIPP